MGKIKICLLLGMSFKGAGRYPLDISIFYV